MNTINLSFTEYQSLTPFTLQKGHSNIEGNFFYYLNELLKSFSSSKIRNNINIDSFTQDKYVNLLTIKKYEEILRQIKELLLPSSIVKVEGTFIGCTMPLLKNSQSLKQILQSQNIDFKTKIKLLKKIGEILENLSQVSKGKFHIGDLHEDNILLTEDGKIKVIDVDSLSLNNGVYFPSKYIVESLVLEDYNEKYKMTRKNGHIQKVYYTNNTDLYCYIIIILNTLANFQMHRLLEFEYFDYLDYLESIGFPIEFLDCIGRIYSTSDNTNPYPILESLPLNRLPEANHLIYTQKTGKPIIYLK